MTSISTRQSGLLTAALNLDDNRTSRLNNRATNTRIQQQDQYTNAKAVLDGLNEQIKTGIQSGISMKQGPFGSVGDQNKRMVYGAIAVAKQMAEALGVTPQFSHEQVQEVWDTTPTGEELAAFTGGTEGLQTGTGNVIQGRVEASGGAPQQDGVNAANRNIAQQATESDADLAYKKGVEDGRQQIGTARTTSAGGLPELTANDAVRGEVTTLALNEKYGVNAGRGRAAGTESSNAAITDARISGDRFLPETLGTNEARQRAALLSEGNALGVPGMNAEAKNAELAATDHAALGAAEGERELAKKSAVFKGTVEILGLKEGTPEYEEFRQQFSGYSPKEYSFNAYTIAAVQEGVAEKLEKGLSLTTEEFSRFKTTAEALGGANFFGQFAKEMKKLNTKSGAGGQAVDDFVLTPEQAAALGINPMTGAPFTVDEVNTAAKDNGWSVTDTIARIKEKVK